MKNMMFSSNENIDYSQSTKKTFGSRKLFLFIMAVLATVSDFALLVVFAISGHGGIAVPVILLILDGLFIAGVCLSNFRFKYSIGVWVAYIIISVIITAFLALLDTKATYMTTTAKYLNVFAHIALYLVTIFASIYPLFKKNIKLKAVMITCVTVAVVLVGAFAVYFSANGYFGQGFLGESRVVGYTLDEESDTYIASLVKSGRSKKVVIPVQFNGKKVSGVECEIFTDKTVNLVEIQTEESIRLLNPQMIENINPNIKIGIDKKYIDVFREKGLKEHENYGVGDGMLNFANALYPLNLASDEVYVTFKYQDYPEQEDIIPTWIGKKGQTFNLNYANVDYLQHVDAHNVDDLVWCYYNNDTQILTGEMINLTGNKISDSLDSVKVDFENVYRFTMADDNDGVYEPADSFKTTLSNNELYAYRFFTIGGARELLDDLTGELIEDRDNGFDLSWQFSLNYNSNNWQNEDWFDLDIDNFLISLEVLSSYASDEINLKLKPIWELKKPTDLKISYFNNKVDYVYGDDVRMDVSAEAPLKGCQLKYSWSWQGDVYGDGEDNADSTGLTYSINNAFPQEGVFTVYVAVSYPEVTDLESFDTVCALLQVDKRPLNITWEEPVDMVYDSYEKVLKHYVGDNELINGDTLDDGMTETNVSNINAGRYTARLSLYGIIDEMYIITSGSTYSYTIAPRSVQTQWTSVDYTYDGNPHNAIATAQGIDSLVPINLSSAKTNAGKYTAVASSASSNYVLTDNTHEFEIKQKNITIGTWSSTPITYNGSAQYPRVATINGLVGNESVNSQLIYSGYASNIDAGEGYSVTVTLPSSSNYKFDSAQSTQYNIAKRALSVRPIVSGKTYDGYAISLNFTASGLVGAHTNGSLGTPTYSGNGVGAIDVGSYTVSISLPNNDVTKNYDITYASASFTITKRALSIRAVASNKTYDGKTNTFDFEVVSGLASAHTKNNLGTPTYSGNGVDAVDAGSYSVSVSLPNNDVTKNYNISYASANFTISKAKVALVWSNVLVSDGRVTAPSVVTSGQVYSGDISVGSYTYRDSSGRIINSIPAVSGTYYVEVAVTSGNYSFTNTHINFTVSVGETQEKEVA